MDTITSLQGTHINHGILLEIGVSNSTGTITTYYLSTAFHAIDYNGNTYQPLGNFLGIGNIQNDITGTNDEINLSLSGIANEYLYNVLDDSNYRIKGSRIKIYRAFFDPDNYALSEVVLRYYGYVTNFSISEEYDAVAGTATNAITLTCSSVHSLLENLVSGRRTNPKDYKVWYNEQHFSAKVSGVAPIESDPSMDLVPSLHNANFDFGKPYTAVRSPIRGGGGGGGGGRDFEDFNVNLN